MLQIGECTQWGTVSAIGVLNGERYYWCVSEATDRLTVGVSMMPAATVESVNCPRQAETKGP